DACMRDPGKLAIADGSVRWRHLELHRQANAWAAQIEELPAPAENVAIQLPHSAQAVAALIGVLMAKRSFLALDPLQPIEQRVAKLRFGNASVLLGLEEDASALRESGWTGVAISPPTVGSGERRQPDDISADSRACLYFTSGTLGNPKAVSW